MSTNSFAPVLERVRELSPFHEKASREMDLAEQAFFFDNIEEGYARVMFHPGKKKFRIEFTPKLLKLDIDTQAFVLMHEVEHVLRGHMTHPKYATPRRWNIAGDACINDDLIDEHFTSMHLDKKLVGMIITHARLEIDEDFETIEEVYRQLPADPELEKKILENVPTSDDIVNGTNENDPDAEDMEEAIEELVREVSRSDGEGGTGVPTRFQDLFAPKHRKRLNYKSLMFDAFGRVKPVPQPTFSKINKRKWATQGIIAPGSRLKQEPRIFVGCDTSGSVQGYIPWFLQELDNCLKDLDAPVDLFFTEAFEKGWHRNISKIDEEIYRAIGYRAPQGGGTEFRWVYPQLIEADPKYDLVLLITDCYTDCPPAPLHALGGRTVVLNVGRDDATWPHCEVYTTDVPNDEWK